MSSRQKTPETKKSMGLDNRHQETLQLEKKTECLATDIKLDFSYSVRNDQEIQVAVLDYITETRYDIEMIHSKSPKIQST